MDDLRTALERLADDPDSPRGADEVLHRAEATNRVRRRRQAGVGIAATLLLAVGIGWVALDEDPPDPVVADRPQSTPSTTAAPSTTTPDTTVPVGSLPNDWEPGLRWDYGTVLSAADGGEAITFDRVGRTWSPEDPPAMPATAPADGVVSGTQWRREPIVVGNTDTDAVNLSDAPRTYRLADDVEVLRIANLRDTCADQADPQPPQWETLTIADLPSVLDDPEYRHGQDALSFDSDGLVFRIRFSNGC